MFFQANGYCIICLLAWYWYWLSEYNAKFKRLYPFQVSQLQGKTSIPSLNIRSAITLYCSWKSLTFNISNTNFVIFLSFLLFWLDWIKVKRSNELFFFSIIGLLKIKKNLRYITILFKRIEKWLAEWVWQKLLWLLAMLTYWLNMTPLKMPMCEVSQSG